MNHESPSRLETLTLTDTINLISDPDTRANEWRSYWTYAEALALIDDYKTHLRYLATKCARHQLAQGVTKTAICTQLGISRTTLDNWLNTPPENT